MSWPSQLDRTNPKDRESYKRGHGFTVDEDEARRGIMKEMTEKRDRVTDYKIRVFDPGIVVEWSVGDEDRIVGCDRWDNRRDNLQAIRHYLRSKRAIGRYQVETPQKEMSNTSVDLEVRDDSDVETSTDRQQTQTQTQTLAGSIMSSVFGSSEDQPEVDEEIREARSLLGVDSQSTEEEINQKYREMMKRYHPDVNEGRDKEFLKEKVKRINEAHDRLTE